MTKPSKVIIWGLNNFSKSYINFLKKESVQIVLIIDGYSTESTYQNIPIQKGYYLLENDEYSNIPIIITAINNLGNSIFNRLKNTITYSLKIKNEILHPYFIRKFSKYNIVYSQNYLKKVIVYFKNNIDEIYLEILKKSNIKVEFILSDSTKYLSYRDIKVFNLHKSDNPINNNTHIPIVIFDQNSFLDTLNIVKKRYSNRLLHPYFVSRYLKIDFLGNYLINYSTGGNGNVLLTKIIAEFVKKGYLEKEILENNIYVNLMHNLFFSYRSVLENFVEKDKTGRSFLKKYSLIENFDDIKYKFINKQKQFSINIKYRYFVCIHDLIPFYFFKKNNFFIFSLIRNPLDIIVSRSVVHSTPSKELSDKEVLDSIDNLIYNLEYFYKQAAWVYDRLKFIIKNVKYENLIKFEDLRTYPLDNMKRIIKYLGVDCPSNNELLEVWNEVDKKKFYSGGVSQIGMKNPLEPRWKKYYTKAHIEILKHIGYEELMFELGYDIKLETDRLFNRKNKENKIINSVNDVVEEDYKKYNQNVNNFFNEKEIIQILNIVDPGTSKIKNYKVPDFVYELMNG